MRDYGEEVPVFIERFGPAYKRELAYFVDRCLKNEPFSVTQEDGPQCDAGWPRQGSVLCVQRARR